MDFFFEIKKFKNKVSKAFFIIKAILSGSRDYGQITIYGPKNFIDFTIETLDLLKEKHPETFTLIEQYISIVCFSKFTMIDVKKRLCLMGHTVLYQSKIRYAGDLAHEVFHCKLYNEYLQSHPGVKNVPKWVDSGEEAEKKCVEYQCQVLEAHGADQETLDYYKNVTNTRYWEVPWEFQDW